jgi:hypothetical protein
LRFVVLLLAPPLLAGCYTYSPIELAAVTPGMEVRARVSAATAVQLGPSLGMSDARLLSGSVVDQHADGLTLKVASVPAGTVGAQEGLFQQILITRADLLELESKKLDDTRTRLAVGTGVVGAVALAATILHGRSSGESAVTEPPANFNLGILRVHVGRFGPLLGISWIGAPRTRTSTTLHPEWLSPRRVRAIQP